MLLRLSFEGKYKYTNEFYIIDVYSVQTALTSITLITLLTQVDFFILVNTYEKYYYLKINKNNV